MNTPHTLTDRSVSIPQRQRAWQEQEAVNPTRGWTHTLVPGIAQTSAYTRGLLSARCSEPELEEIVQGRLRRGQAVLDGGPQRRYVFSQSALDMPWLSAGHRHEQLEHLAVVANLAHVQMLVLPASTPVPHGPFMLLREWVYIEGPGGLNRLPQEVTAEYTACFEALCAAAHPYALEHTPVT
ncbi:Scr1 family TA system antitoxin-like transcriptional regulator [Nocardiopsis synnemataformans]|uniref:Scr1 family TA system antitoxin-like transcriptional regulator n=1 Tax=Nocardiopsis synnemataformans TaxID=61305 RepID=UPI003EB85493